MKRSRMKGIGSIICLFLATVLFCTPAMAYTGENWYNTDIDGAVTADTPEVRPQDDFNLAINRDYIMNLVIPEGNIGAGGFNTIRQQVNQMRLEAIQDETLTGHDAELVRKYYDLLMDWDTRDAQGVSPAMPYINEIRAIDSLEAMTARFADETRGGLYAFGDGDGHGSDTGGLFAYGLCISADDSTARALAIPMRWRCPPENSCGKRFACSVFSPTVASRWLIFSRLSACVENRLWISSGSPTISPTVMRGFREA